jgi:hypothetical protein
MDTEQVFTQLLLMAGLLALPAPVLWMEARALQRVARLAGQSRWRQRLALVPRAASVGILLMAGVALAMYLYYRVSPPEGLQAFLEGQRAATASVNSFYGLLSTVGTVTLATLAVTYGLVLLGFLALAQERAPARQAQTEQRASAATSSGGV